MSKNYFFKVFDKNKFMFIFRIIILLFLFVLLVNMINIAYSRYETNTSSVTNANIAFFVVDQGSYNNTISLSGLIPSNTPYQYQFTVSNFNNNKRANVNIDYSINFTTTTNIPLTFEIIRNETYGVGSINIISNTETIQDDNGVYYKIYSNGERYNFNYNVNTTDTYTLIVHFPIEYQNNSEEYQSMIDLFSINIDAKQVV